MMYDFEYSCLVFAFHMLYNQTIMASVDKCVMLIWALGREDESKEIYSAGAI